MSGNCPIGACGVKLFSERNRTFLLAAAVAVAAVAVAVRVVERGRPPVATATAAQAQGCNGDGGPGTVATDSGPVRGVADGATLAFKGIPYAAPPVGALRWQPPQPAGCHAGVVEATAFGPACPQFNERREIEGDEDCLTLNLWTPGTTPAADPLPVMVFIHGGGNAQGTSGQPVYNGRQLAERGVVLVTFNYRLGALGFLALPGDGENGSGSAGNYGIRDQIALLQWVQRNISAFGGDPSRVMIFGESAGAVDTCVLVASPPAAGLFHRALMESGACLGPSMQGSAQTGARYLTASPCASAADVMGCLRALPMEEVLRVLPPTVSVASAGENQYGPVIDGEVLPASPLQMIQSGRHNRVAFVIGANADETGQATGRIESEAQYRALVGSLLGPALSARALEMYPVSEYGSPRATAVAMTSDARFICQTRVAARATASNQDEPVYRYHFTQRLRGAGAALGSFHGLELAFVFGTLGSNGAFTPDAAERALIDAMQGYWTRFAATGDPNGPNAPSWPRYDTATDPYLQLGTPVEAGAGVRTRQCDFWASLG